jgi:hypothetical protein
MKRRIVCLAILFHAAGQAEAGTVVFYSVFKNIAYTQTGNAQPTTPSSFFVNGGVFSNLANDLTSGSVTNNSSAASFNMSVANPNTLSYGGFESSLAAMNAAFPDGSTDQFSVTSTSQGTLSDSLPQPASSLFTSNIPYLTNFNGLKGMNPNGAFTVHFPSTQPVGVTNDSNIYFSVFGAIGSGGLPNSATSFVIPAHTLLPNTTYTFELDYSNRLDTPATGNFSGGTGIAGYDVRTDGTFTTGPASVPEPASIALFALVAVAMLGVGIRH